MQQRGSKYFARRTSHPKYWVSGSKFNFLEYGYVANQIKNKKKTHFERIDERASL